MTVSAVSDCVDITVDDDAGLLVSQGDEDAEIISCPVLRLEGPTAKLSSDIICDISGPPSSTTLCLKGRVACKNYVCLNSSLDQIINKKKRSYNSL